MKIKHCRHLTYYMNMQKRYKSLQSVHGVALTENLTRYILNALEHRLRYKFVKINIQN